MKLVDFQGFRFGNVHSSDLNLEVVSTSNRYEARTLPAPTDTTTDIPGSDGQYYFGSIFKNRDITINVAFDNVSEENYRKIKQLFATDKPQDLVFDEEPYKTWKAKLKAKPDFKSLCFTNSDGERVYKGDGKLQFICYFPYAFGFDKYIIKAADYYLLHTPEQILCELSNDESDFYFASRSLPAPAWIPSDLRYHYNVNPKDRSQNEPSDLDNKEGRGWEPNDGLSWKTGFPTIDQVQNGELYFDLDGTEKTLVTTRGYWDNIPEWQCAAKLLTTPTLDFDQGLMYLPQYSKVNYINMETGFDKSRPMIGSRLLVYNPGDLPIDWELRIDVDKKGFWSQRGSKFRVRRFNVDRLSIAQAVDWCGMTTYNPNDEELYKYGDKYFKRKAENIKGLIEILEDNGFDFKADKYWSEDDQYTDGAPTITYNLHLDDDAVKTDLDKVFNYEELKAAHPKYCYYIEPIPRQMLGHYIKLFYWQSYDKLITILPQLDQSGPIEKCKAAIRELNYEIGIAFANRYEEILKQCVSEEEEYELYWNTLKQLLDKYRIIENAQDIFKQYVNNPLEFIGVTNFNQPYDEEDFNITDYPKWMTKDYLEIDTSLLSGVKLIKEYMAAIGEDEFSIFTGKIVRYNPSLIEDNKKLKRKMDKLLLPDQPLNDLLNDYFYLNSESRMLYATDNPIGDIYHYKPVKNVMNEAITKGKWFKLPPGWSVIMIEPIVDETLWGGKRWLDARPFDWGYGGDAVGHQRAVSQLYDYVYGKAKDYFFENLYPNFTPENMYWPEENRSEGETQDTDKKINFKLWYEDMISNTSYYLAPYFDSLTKYWKIERITAEYALLNIIHDIWQVIAPHYQWTITNDYPNDNEIDINGERKRVINANISDWWWYAANYIWANFPPLYWAAADCFNKIKIKYTPLFY